MPATSRTSTPLPGPCESSARSRRRSRSTTEQLRALPAIEVTTDIHCVTRWSRFDAGFRGVHWSELAKLCRPKPSGHFVIAHAEAGLHGERPDRRAQRGERARRVRGGRRAAGRRARRAGAPRRPLPLLLEERQVAERHRARARPTSPASGSATATTTTPTPGKRSGTGSDRRPHHPRWVCNLPSNGVKPG